MMRSRAPLWTGVWIFEQGLRALVFHDLIGNTVSFQEVIMENDRTSPSGTTVFSLSGRSWVEGLIGHWTVNPETGELTS